MKRAYPPLLTIPEFAKAIKRSYPVARQMAIDGQIESRKCGSRLLIPADAVDKFLAAGGAVQSLGNGPLPKTRQSKPSMALRRVAGAIHILRKHKEPLGIAL